MKIKQFLTFFLLMSALILVACAPQAETEPGAAEPTSPAETAAPPTEEATAETIEPTSAAETIEPSAVPSPTMRAEPTLAPLNLCADFPRPALLLYLADESYALFNPDSGETCLLPFLNTVPGMALMAQKEFFVAIPTVGGEGNATIIMHYEEDGLTWDDLDYTAVNNEAGSNLVAFTVSDDAGLIAWSVIGPTGGSDIDNTSLHIADVNSGQVIAGVSPVVEDQLRALRPIRFSDDGTTLFYTLQPYGLGGRWTSFNARYDNLYAVDFAASEHPELIFDCAELGLSLCLGDFTTDGPAVTSLAYVDQEAGTIAVQNGSGEILNTFEVEDNYLGYPTFGPGGEFVFYSAEISDDPNAVNAAVQGNLHRAAPIVAPAETLASDAALLYPIGFLNDHQIVVYWANEDGSWTLALAGLDGTVQPLNIPAGSIPLGSSVSSTLLSAMTDHLN